MLGELAIGNANDVGGNPCRRTASARETAVDDDEIAVGQDHAGLVAEACRCGADQIEEPVSAGRYMSAMLNVQR